MNYNLTYNKINRADRDYSPIRQATYLFSALLLIGILLRSEIMSTETKQEKLKRLTIYYPETGVFFDRETGVLIGSLNTSENQGYWSMSIKGIRGNRSRLAWIYMEGFDPKGYDVDHKNRIRFDDKWENLRLATRQCNSRNCNLKKANKSGITGVFWFKRDRKWTAQIFINYKAKHLGYFDTKIEAAKARWQAEKDNNFPDCNTYSTAYLYLKESGVI